MLSNDSIRELSSSFCGDTGGYYQYKTGQRLVDFFNEYFGYADIYSAGFPSRWSYVYDRIVDLSRQGRLDDFMSLILNKEYIMREQRCNEVEATLRSQQILLEFNRIVESDLYNVIHKDNTFSLRKIDEDLEFIGAGGFANVYFQKSTNLMIKKLKDDYLTDEGIRSRFRREYNITKSLSDLHGVITVHDFNEGNCSYTLERADATLEHYITNQTIPEELVVHLKLLILD